MSEAGFLDEVAVGLAKALDGEKEGFLFFVGEGEANFSALHDRGVGGRNRRSRFGCIFREFGDEVFEGEQFGFEGFSVHAGPLADG